MGSPDTKIVEDDFQFILCEGCGQESSNLKLLTCLHTLCLGCVDKYKPVGQCPVCQTPIPQASSIPDVDNLLFTNLQARLKLYKKIVDGVDLFCSICRKAGEFWCSECEEFLCTKCCQAHQRYLKMENHQAKRVVDIRAGSAKDFLEDARKNRNFSCSNLTHKSHNVSIYCRTCEKALCCSCALLDSQHAPFCDIRSETRRRQEELGSLSRDLRQKRGALEASYASLQDEAARLERARRETRELIRQRVEQLVRLLRREEEELLGLAEARQELGRRELAGELRRLEGALRRLEAGERLVEKMKLYATEQEVMDMQPFVRDSLEELRRLQPAAGGERARPGDLAECLARLQALVERVTGRPDTGAPAVPAPEKAPDKGPQEKAQVERVEGHPAPLPMTGTSAPQHNSPFEDETTQILDPEPPREHCQPHGDVPHNQPCALASDPSSSRRQVCPDQGEDIPLTQPTPPALPMQRDEEAEEDLRSAHGNTVPPPRSIQDSLASLQEDFCAWARSNVQQTDKFLKMGHCLLQAQQRANRHLVSMTQEIQAISCSLATITSAVGPWLHPVASPENPPTASMDWPSLPSDLLDLLPSSTPQISDPVVPEAATNPGCFSRPPPSSPALSETPSLSPKEECPKSRHHTMAKRGGKPSTRLRKRRKK